MTFDVSICNNCFWYNKTWCDAEYHKRAVDVYEKCHKHLEKHKGQMSIDELLETRHEEVHSKPRTHGQAHR